MLALNQLTLSGNLTRHPELQETGTQRKVAHFALAHNRRVKGADGQARVEVLFIDVEAWDATAAMVGEHLRQGSGVVVTGRIRMDTWEDRQTHANRSRLVLVAHEVHFLPGGRGEDRQGRFGDRGRQQPAVQRSGDTRGSQGFSSSNGEAQGQRRDRPRSSGRF